MNQPAWTGPNSTRAPAQPGRGEPSSLADILERVLDKGIVIAGDIRVDLLDIELLTIKIRLIVASVDRAREMGIDWWEHDPALSSQERDVVEENRRLRRRVGDLEAERSAGPAQVTASGAEEATEPAAEEEHRRPEPAGEPDSRPDGGRSADRGRRP
ncbi:gas vesicle protein [Actinacidiphila acididurans]|uniref:Gas vesicle protein n=1 Tax=Actinacidiphila acididurans TaxID=2784346 RepID=A0ABS2TTX6_9ACTN|nr:gas vesicle protein [Actinacidiphila acididurans]MBM9506272.1 gas vesicle protein [Actinacidiphila acididurans]